MQGTVICHYGIKGMKWGVRRAGGLKTIIARRANKKVDDSFDKWKKNDALKKEAISAGYERNKNKIAYDQNRTDKKLKSAYKDSESAYKKALSKNTTYRKGSVREAVGRDLSRKYLSEAKKLKKRMDSGEATSKDKKQYSKMMNNHDIERARARRAQSVAEKRMNRIRVAKTTATKTLKTAAATAIIGAGIALTDKYITKGKIKATVADVSNAIKLGKEALSYTYI